MSTKPTSVKNFLPALSILFVWVALADGSCPHERNLEPCTCTSVKDGISVQCNGPQDVDRISQVLRSLTSSSGNFELMLESLTLPFLPPTVQDVSSLRLYDVHLGKIQNAATVTWPKLNDMVIDSSRIGENIWPCLKRAMLLRHLKISNMEMPVIGSEFKDSIPSEVAYLELRKTKTTTIESYSMSHLKDLKYFLLVDVPLQEFPRDVLPSEMPDIHTFILGNTQIKKLETGFFEGMPKLEVLMLNGNRLTTLDSSLFSAENHLMHLLAERNPLTCSCNLLWLTKNVQEKGSMKVWATCTDSVSQERKEVTSLDESEYCA